MKNRHKSKITLAIRVDICEVHLLVQVGVPRLWLARIEVAACGLLAPERIAKTLEVAFRLLS